MIEYRTSDGTFCSQVMVLEVRMANALLFLSLGHLTKAKCMYASWMLGSSKKLKNVNF